MVGIYEVNDEGKLTSLRVHWSCDAGIIVSPWKMDDPRLQALETKVAAIEAYAKRFFVGS